MVFYSFERFSNFIASHLIKTFGIGEYLKLLKQTNDARLPIRYFKKFPLLLAQRTLIYQALAIYMINKRFDHNDDTIYCESIFKIMTNRLPIKVIDEDVMTKPELQSSIDRTNGIDPRIRSNFYATALNNGQRGPYPEAHRPGNTLMPQIPGNSINQVRGSTGSQYSRRAALAPTSPRIRQMSPRPSPNRATPFNR